MAIQKKIETAEGGSLKIIPLGGQEEVGRNMTIFEYQGDIIILDVGLQFPEEDMPGIDYVIPDIKYLRGKEKQVKGVILSHGHLDHIGALPHILPKLNWPPVYASKMTLALVRRRLAEFNLSRYFKPQEVKTVKEKLSLGKFQVNFFDVTHSIMDAFGVVIQTPVANVIDHGDWRYDIEPGSNRETDFSHLAAWNKQKTPAILMMESLGSTKPGNQIPETDVYREIDKIMTQAPGRVVVATFASMVERVSWIINIAESLGKKVAIDGYSMKTTVEIAKQIGYMKFKPHTLIDMKAVRDYPDDKVVIICTGAQGEKKAVLPRIANGEHPYIKVKKADTIIFSSSVIPGNERTVQRVKDTLYRQSDHVIHKEIMAVHGGGHALIEDIKFLLKQVKPKYLIPVYANHYFLKEAGKVAISIGFPADNIFYLDDGSVLEMTGAGGKITSKIPLSPIFVDGSGVGDISDVVLRDRQSMSEGGIMVVVSVIEKKTGKLKQDPDVISRGFVYMRESKELIQEVRRRVRVTIEKQSRKNVQKPTSYQQGGQNGDSLLKNLIRDELSDFFYKKTERRPIVIPVIIRM